MFLSLFNQSTFALILIFPLAIVAKIKEPDAFIIGGISYQSHANEVEATDVRSKQVLWNTVVYASTEPEHHNPHLEADVQWDIINSVSKQGDTLLVTNGRGEVFRLDLKTGKPITEKASVEIPLTGKQSIIVPCRTSKGWEDGFEISRVCSIVKSHARLIMRIEALSNINSFNFRTLIGPFQVPVDWFADITSGAQLIDFMKAQTDGNWPRYVLDGIDWNLEKVKSACPIGTVYDLSPGYFDPREPSSSDIFVIMKEPRRLLLLKDARHLHFNWQDAYLKHSS